MAKENVIEDKEKWFAENQAFLDGENKSSFWLSDNWLLRILLLVLEIIVWIMSLFKEKAIDAEEYEKRVNMMANGAKRKVFAALGIDPSQVNEVAPIVTNTYLIGGDTTIRYDEDSPKFWTSKFQTSFILFGKEEIYCYKYTFDMTQDIKEETSFEYFYTDIISLVVEKGTSHEENTIEIPTTGLFKFFKQPTMQKITRDELEESFSFLTNGGYSTKFYFRSSNGASITKQINALKQLIREKKQ